MNLMTLYKGWTAIALKTSSGRRSAIGFALTLKGLGHAVLDNFVLFFSYEL